MSQNQTSEGAACPKLDTDYTYGGAYGVNGCGAYAITSLDTSTTLTNWHVFNESALGAQSESNDAKGNAAYTTWWQCNYDCNLYPF